MSFVPREERARRSRQAQFANGQRPGGSDVDPRQRRSSEAELQTSQRVGDGQEVDANGRAQVRKDKTIEVDSRNRHRVAADNLRFATPVDGSQAATKDYVDGAIDSIVTGSAWQSVSKLPETRTSLGGDGYVVVDQSSNFHYFGALTDFDNLAGVGVNGLQLATGYIWVLRQQVIVGNQSGGTRTVQVRLVQDQGGSIITLTMFSTDIGNGAVRTINLETISSGGDDVYLEVGTTSATNGGIVIDSARLHAQLMELRNDPDITGSLPPPLGITASFSAESLTAIAWTDDVAFLDTSLGDADTFTWTFDEWGPTYLDYSGAYGSLVSHRFMDGGTHTVELTASGPSGSDTATVDVVVQDVVETQNLLTTDAGARLDFTDFTFPNYSWTGASGPQVVTTSPIAAPDGTLTAQNIVGSAYVYNWVTALGQGNYIEDAACTFSVYWYWPSGISKSARWYIYTTAPGSGTALEKILIDWNRGAATPTVYSITAATSGSESYTAEKNISVQSVGDSGWYKVSATINMALDQTGTTLWFWPIYASNGTLDFIYWNPTLRYGDWVSRGKNWQGTPLIDWAITAGASKAYSATAAPDGTLSAVQTSLPAGGNCDISATNAIAAAVPAYASVTLEAYINHSDGDWDSGRIYHYLRSSSAFPEMVYIEIDPAGGFAASLVTLATSGPGYTTAEHAEATQIGTNGWWRYRLTITDYGGTALTTWNYLRAANSAGATRGVFWGPRITVGNPADMLDYFVSGPQNLLGDGSNYDPATSGWATVGSSPPTVTTNTHVAPNGRLEADTIALPAGNFTALHRYSLNGQLPTGVAGASREYQFYIKRDASTPNPQFLFSWFMYDGRYAVIERFQFVMQLNGPTISALSAVTTGGPGYTVDDIELTNVSNDWVRLRMRLTDYSGTCNGSGYIQHYNYSTSNPASLVLWGSEITTITPKTPV